MGVWLRLRTVVVMTPLEQLAWRNVINRIDPPPSKLACYYNDPVAFADDCITWQPGEGLAPYQRENLTAIVEHGRVAVRGPHGLGKTTEKAIAVLWFAITRDDAHKDWKIPTTASAWRQLEQYLWPEIHKWARRLRWDVIGRPPFRDGVELQVLQLKLTHGHAFAVASDQPALIEGAHADAILYVFDEAKAIPPATFDAAEGAFSGAGADTVAEAYAFASSTPGEPNGRFYDIHARKTGLEDWWTRHVTLAETIAAGRVSGEWAEKRARQWGTDSAVYANRVLGEFHTSDEDGVIPLEWIERANERWVAWDLAGRPGRSEHVIVGVDVARSGADQTVIAPRFGWTVDELRYSSKEGTTGTSGRVEALLRHYGSGRAIVDVIGLGAGVKDELRDHDLDAVGFVAGKKTARLDASGEFGFADCRAAAWWNLRELLDPDRGRPVALPPDDLLVGDLTAPKWRVVVGGRIRVESKDDIKKRLGRSTDSADAVVQAFWDGEVEGELVASRWQDQRSKGRRRR
jgi:hypothetical protein